MKTDRIRKSTLFYLLLVLLIFPAWQESEPIDDTDYLENFQNPPDEAHPRVWWHWMNGNVTKDGIRKELEWMNRVGIRGFHNFDASLLTPVVENKITFITMPLVAPDQPLGPSGLLRPVRLLSRSVL